MGRGWADVKFWATLPVFLLLRFCSDPEEHGLSPGVDPEPLRLLSSQPGPFAYVPPVLDVPSFSRGPQSLTCLSLPCSQRYFSSIEQVPSPGVTSPPSRSMQNYTSPHLCPAQFPAVSTSPL